MAYTEDCDIIDLATLLLSRENKSPYVPDSPFHPNMHSLEIEGFHACLYEDEGAALGSSIGAAIEAFKIIREQDVSLLVVSSGFSSLTSQGRVLGEIGRTGIVRYNPFISPFSHEVFSILSRDFSQDVAISILVKHLIDDLGWDQRAAITYISIYMGRSVFRVEELYSQRFHRDDGREYIQKAIGISHGLSRSIFNLTAPRRSRGKALVICSVKESQILSNHPSNTTTISKSRALSLLDTIKQRDLMLGRYAQLLGGQGE